RACFFSDLFTGEFFPLRIPFDRLRAAVSPIPKSRKEQRPPASHLRKDFMVLPVRRIRVKKDIHSVCTAVVTELKQQGDESRAEARIPEAD
ncbi:MAG: hypothetical protein JSV40_06870, partial [Deltaproteobacteria bacterium]